MNIYSYSDIYKEDSTLRPYQQKAKKEIFESWDVVDNVMFQMPTGTGKTRLFTSIIRDINDYSKQRREPVKILIIAHRTELIDQIDESLTKYQVPHNVIAGGKDRNYKFPVNVASIQTITHPNNLKDAKKLAVQFVIIDEAHHALAATYKKLWNLYPGSKKLGVTATPWRMNHQSFLDLFDTIVLSMPIKDFIKQGYLAPYKYFSLRSNSDIQKTIDDIELDRFGEYKESSMEEKMDIGSIRAQLLDSYLSLAEGKKGIIYAINIVHAQHICDEYKKAGYKAVSIDSKTPSTERKELVGKFKKGLVDIIVNVDIFSEGFDCPDIEFIQLARPTRSLVKYLQQVGRGLRITENKQECIILDNVGMYSRFGLPNARRHWKQHFLGKNVVDEPKRNDSKGAGRTRNVDFSEGTEDMELIQDVYDDVELKNNFHNERSHSSIDDFFPLFGVTLGKTTWKEMEDLGVEVLLWRKGPGRYVNIKNVVFGDYDGKGIFTTLNWTAYDSPFPLLWKSKGFSWKNPFNEWLNVFENLRYHISIKKQPTINEYEGHKTFCAEIEAISPDCSLSFDLDFNYGENGYYSSSPNTLYSITVDYNGSASAIMDKQDITEEKYDPLSSLKAINYQDNNYIFWFKDNKKIYETYIQDDIYFIVSELIIDKENRCIHRNRVGKIPTESWMFWQMEREKVDNLKSITHYGANYTVFHYQVLDKDKQTKDKFFDYKGREIESPSVIEAKFKNAQIGGGLHNYIDVPVSKATYRVEIKTSHIKIFRTLKEISKPIAELPLLSDFGKKYIVLSEMDNAIRKKNGLTKFSDHTTPIFKICRSDDNSFTFRFSENNREYLYKYDYKGKIVHKGTIATYQINRNNQHSDTDIDKLWHVFDSKATTYKYFWFLSIMQLYKENKETSILYKQILVRMISNAWCYVFMEGAEFPKSDQIPKIIDILHDKFKLDDSSAKTKVESQILYYYERSHLDRILSPLLKNVPYRFLSPWIPFTDNEDVKTKSNQEELMCPYSLHEDHISINSAWCDFLLEYYDKINSFTVKELHSYLNLK